jgi:hypothetical protein
MRVHQPAEAIVVTEPSVGVHAKSEGILRYIRAFAFSELGDVSKPRDEGLAALALATSERQRERMRAGLKNIDITAA